MRVPATQLVHLLLQIRPLGLQVAEGSAVAEAVHLLAHLRHALGELQVEGVGLVFHRGRLGVLSNGGYFQVFNWQALHDILLFKAAVPFRQPLRYIVR